MRCHAKAKCFTLKLSVTKYIKVVENTNQKVRCMCVRPNWQMHVQANKEKENAEWST